MLSVTIISLNAEDKIANAIKSVSSLADEIIVVDCGSSDRTAKIAQNLGADVYFHSFNDFASQKNWAVSKAKGDWILALDADEQIPPDLADEIKSVIKNNQYAGFLIPRRNFILGREIKHSRWSPDTHIWLWQKKLGSWVGDVHEEVKVSGEVSLLSSSKLHYSHSSIGDFMKANDLYSSLQALSLHKRGIKYSLLKLLSEPIFEFFIRFIYKLGFLDGKAGFILAYLMGIYKLSVWIKVWELEIKK